jgi:hypothetical protein
VTELSQEALFDLTYSAIALGDSLFELWLTVTFAAILAVYFSSSRMTPFMRRLLLGLYCAASVLLTGRWVVAMLHFITYREMLASQGFAEFPSPQPLGFILGILHFATFVLGTVGTVYFMLSFGARDPESESAV